MRHRHEWFQYKNLSGDARRVCHECGRVHKLVTFYFLRFWIRS